MVRVVVGEKDDHRLEARGREFPHQPTGAAVVQPGIYNQDLVAETYQAKIHTAGQVAGVIGEPHERHRPAILPQGSPASSAVRLPVSLCYGARLGCRWSEWPPSCIGGGSRAGSLLGWGAVKVWEEADGVFRIPVHNPFGVHPTNAYLLVGDRKVLFDVGPGYRRTWEDLRGALSYVASRPEEIEIVILSHGHADHDGLAHRFTWASILIHEADLPKVADYNGHLDRYEEAVRSIMPVWGLGGETAEIIPGLFAWLRAAGGPAPWAEAIEDGANIQGAGGSWRVVALPGHTEGLIGLYRAEDRLLLSSDQLLETTVPNPGFYLSGTAYVGNGMADYERSLHRLEQMAVQRVLPGHGSAFADFSGHLAHFLEQYKLRLDQAESILQGASTVHQVAELLFPGCDPRNPYHVFITHLEAVARLSVLADRGRIRRREGNSGGPDRYERCGP